MLSILKANGTICPEGRKWRVANKSELGYMTPLEYCKTMFSFDFEKVALLIRIHETRFKDIQSAVHGISDKVLTERVRQMVDDRLLERLTAIRQNKRTL